MKSIRRIEDVELPEYLKEKMSEAAKLVCIMYDIEGLDREDILKHNLMERNIFYNSLNELIKNDYLTVHKVREKGNHSYIREIHHYNGRYISVEDLDYFYEQLDEMDLEEIERIKKFETKPIAIENKRAAAAIRQNKRELKRQKELLRVSEGKSLDVPYEDKDLAKQLGACWSGICKTWYAPYGTNFEDFRKWFELTDDKKVVKPIEIIFENIEVKI